MSGEGRASPWPEDTAMAIHDWTRVPACVFHHFHHSWIEEIQRALNAGVLPEDYYAMAEQQAAGFGPDVLTLQAREATPEGERTNGPGSSQAMTLIRPQARFTAQTDEEFFRRKKSAIAVRHVSDDRLVAMLEI